MRPSLHPAIDFHPPVVLVVGGSTSPTPGEGNRRREKLCSKQFIAQLYVVLVDLPNWRAIMYQE
jgi:hypothetical protein